MIEWIIQQTTPIQAKQQQQQIIQFPLHSSLPNAQRWFTVTGDTCLDDSIGRLLMPSPSVEGRRGPGEVGLDPPECDPP